MTKEIFEKQRIIHETNRCLLCYDAPCSKACPHKAAPADFIQSIRFENQDGAIEQVKVSKISRETVQCCTQKYCEKACLRGKIDSPLEISKIHQYLVQQCNE